VSPKPGSPLSGSVDRPLGRLGRVVLAIALLVGVAVAMPDPVSVLNFLAYAGIGVFVAIRRPHNPIGWILVVIAFSFIATSAIPDDIEAVKSGTSSAPDFLAAWVGTWAGGTTYLAYATLAMIFPSGRLPTGRWRRAALGSLVLGLGVVAAGAIMPKFPFSPDGGVTNFMVPNRFALIPPIDIDVPVPGEIFIVIPLGVFALYDAERTSTAFAERLRDDVDIDLLRAALATTAGGAVAPSRVGVWLRSTTGSAR